MADKHKTARQPQDQYGQRSKLLSSAVQRLRGWVGSDPSRATELADALVELTEHRLLGHSYAAAAADAQDAVQRAAQLLTANGPIGPYTSVTDAVRCITTLVHVGMIQVGAGLLDAAGRTLASLRDLREQLQELPVLKSLRPQTAIWALSSTARVALAEGDVAAANAYADAALARLAESGLREDPDAAYLTIDVDRLASDCRWAAGDAVAALSFLHAAKDAYDQLVADRLREPGRLSPALLERLVEPLFGLYRDLADRLVGTGELEVGLVTRRALVETLQGVVGRLGDPARWQLVTALADLAGDLLTAKRADEADVAAGEALATLAPTPGAAATPAGKTMILRAAAVRARALMMSGQGGEAVALLQTMLPAEPAVATSAAAVALAALAEALRAEGELDAAEDAQRSFDVRARELLGAAADLEDAPSAVLDLARGVVSRGRQVAWAPLGPDDAYSATTAAGTSLGEDVLDLTPEAPQETTSWLAAERSEAHRLEQERLEQARLDAERREAERAQAEQEAAEQQAVERAAAARAEQLEAERLEAAVEAERIARRQRRQEKLEAHRLEVERREAERIEAERIEAEQLHAHSSAASGLDERDELDEVAAAQQAWRDAKGRGDRKGARLAGERVVELLRPRAQADLAEHGPQLRAALEELAGARLRGGDVWGSRGAAREAKALAKTLDH